MRQMGAFSRLGGGQLFGIWRARFCEAQVQIWRAKKKDLACGGERTLRFRWRGAFRPARLTHSSDVTAQLFLLSGGGSSAVYTALEPATTFRTVRPEVTYYVNQLQRGDVPVPGFGYMERVTVVMRAWEGPSYETAQVRGQSNPVTVTLGPPVPSPLPIVEGVLVGLEGFSLCVPEPSTSILAAIATALLLPFGRKESAKL